MAQLLASSEATPLPREIMDAISHDVRREVPGRAESAASPDLRTRHISRRMKIHIVCYEDDQAWILGKFARRLLAELRGLGMEASLGKAPDPAAEINHHIVYFDYLEQKSTVETVMITHIADKRELQKVGRQLIDIGVEMGICMSRDAVRRLAHFGMPRAQLCYINPAHDNIIQPRKILVGLTTRVYPDGCKREHMLLELAGHISPGDFKFAIMGSGWDAIVAQLRDRGFEVEYFAQFDYATYCRLMPSLDYYLYFGLDDGSMGFLDAVAAGVGTIVTPQGYHLDVPDGITHAFQEPDELREIFSGIADRRNRKIQAVAGLTWAEYSLRHLFVWECLLRRKAGQDIPGSLRTELPDLAVATAP